MANQMGGGQGSATVSTSEILDGLNDLLQLNHDAIGAYDIAIEKLENQDQASQISGFRLDHERHIRELNQAIQQLGGTPKNEPHATGPFKQAMQSLGAMAGDKGTLLAWRTNELQVRTKYDGYASRANAWPEDLKRMVDEHALDEERHYRWVADELRRMGVAPGEGMETEMLDKLRERANVATAQARQVADRARERLGGAAEGARTRTADGLERAAHRLDQMADRQGASGGARARAAGAAHRTADGLEATAGYLRAADPAALRHDLEAQVRTSPLRTLVVAFGVGFVIGRILR